MRGIRLYAILAAMFMAGAFLASPELRVYAANTVGSADIINNSILSADIKDGEVKTVDLGNDAVTSAKIKNGEVKTDDIAPSAIGSLRLKDNDVKAQDLAPDSVGASELQGVSKLTFTGCSFTFPGSVSHGGVIGSNCPVPGMVPGDKVSVTSENGYACFPIVNAYSQTGGIVINLINACTTPAIPGTQTFSVISYSPG
jgi:hypothetical protein